MPLTLPVHSPIAENAPVTRLLVDAGIEKVRFRLYDDSGTIRHSWSVFAGADLHISLTENPISPELSVFVTGKLQSVVRKQIGRGEHLLKAAVLWQATSEMAKTKQLSVALLDLSASGYTLIGMSADGTLKDELLITNPRCGSGPGINLDRVLRKLAVERENVDRLLVNYLGEQRRSARQEIPVRADRCGVFASSATISDKNQGTPLDVALATTLKSEVVKACKQLKSHFDEIWLTGGVFRWQFARDCAADYFQNLDIFQVHYDYNEDTMFTGLLNLSDTIQITPRKNLLPLAGLDKSIAYCPPLFELRSSLKSQHLYHRQTDCEYHFSADILNSKQPVLVAIDVGSSMAKVLIASGDGENILFKGAYSNSGDTIETIKVMFNDLSNRGIRALQVAKIGLTGSARYQIQKTLVATYPELLDRVTVLVENYAHARGSVDLARHHIENLKQLGVTELNERLCILVDVGGEDTKISTIDLQQGDLYDNAMNTKCSAGTGSLLDTLADLFAIYDIRIATQEALGATRARMLNATCAVFLLEHARLLQAEGQGRADILASAIWAIVENMARSLWPQIYLPQNAVVLLHGQTMQSDALPLAVTARLQQFFRGAAYCLVPAEPGHRACVGLVRTLSETIVPDSASLPLATLLEKQFTRRLILCQGTACGDPEARCQRSQLSATDAQGSTFSVTLGGCTAINERPHRRSLSTPPVPDTCASIWQYQREQLPASASLNRLVIPRSFAVSEWACFFAALLTPCDIPVHVDTPTEEDILRGQAHFRVDTCAPHIGVVGQFLRLAEQSHGIIIAPQIEFLPLRGKSLGRTCTINQGGFAVARGIAIARFPQSRIELFHLDLNTTDIPLLAHKLYSRLLPVYQFYGVEIDFDAFQNLVHEAMVKQHSFRRKTADYAADLAQQALKSGHGVALVIGREYILNPGVFDSHVGRLLRDKGLAGIPSYLLDAQCDDRFSHLYWRNAHLNASLAAALAERRLHRIVFHPGLQEVFKQCEESDQLVPVVQVSTFLCGPDSVTSPLINELVKNRPYLRIQSDAAIKELAHLENRLNTYVKQLAASGAQRIMFAPGLQFDVELLDLMVSRNPIDPCTDLICFPTLGDNRSLLAVLRSAGYSTLENYTPEYSLQTLIEQGRKVSGDSVCAPLAAVYGDVLNAINSFQRQRETAGVHQDKKRLLIFNNKGLGPCRQGQYVEAHKVFLNQSNPVGIDPTARQGDELVIQFLIGHENSGFNTGFPRWVFLRGVQATILQGVLHQILAAGSARCRSDEEYQSLLTDYEALKDELYLLIEKESAPGLLALRASLAAQKLPVISQITDFFAYRLHRNYLGEPLRRFRKRWCKKPLPKHQIRIHIDGEAYMRTAQFEQIHQGLLKILGPGRFHLTYTPLWGFLEYKLAGMMMRARESIAESEKEIKRSEDSFFVQKRKKFLWKKRKRLVIVSVIHRILRSLLAAPLYRSAGIDMPEKLPKVLERAKEIIVTRRPGGELIPYIGEVALKLEKGYDLVLNIAPEGCMVSSMGEAITPAIYQYLPNSRGKIQPIFSQQGDVDEEKLLQALLLALGPERIYRF